MTATAARSTIAVPDSPVVEALVALNAAPDLFDTMEQYLTNPTTPAAVRRFIAHILDRAEHFATTPAVTL
jgi:hypothetical protein